jgi:hypothetical protein
MGPVVKEDVPLKGDLSIQKPLGVTSLLKASGIAYFGPGPFTVCPRKVAGNLSQGAPSRNGLAITFGRVVTLHAGDLAVAGRFPVAVMRAHDMTRISAEDRGLGDLKNTPHTDDKQDEEKEKDLIKPELPQQVEDPAQHMGRFPGFFPLVLVHGRLPSILPRVFLYSS